MKRMMMTAALTIAAVNFLIAQSPDAAPQAKQQDTSPIETKDFGMTLTDVPELLRMHLPMLPAGAGWVVQNVVPDGPAAAMGVQPGDVLIELDGQPIGDLRWLDRATERSTMMVVRRGIPHRLPRGRPALIGGNMRPMPANPFANPRHWIGRSGMNRQQFSSPGVTASSSSSSSSSSGEAVSVSRSGDKISLSISSTDAAIGEIELSGTMDEIRRELGGDTYSDAAKAAIRRAIGE